MGAIIAIVFTIVLMLIAIIICGLRNLYLCILRSKCPKCGSHFTRFQNYTRGDNKKKVFYCKRCGQRFIKDKKK